MESALFFAAVYLATLAAVLVLERLRVPWVFVALLLGIAFATYDPFPQATTSETFVFLGELGMYFFLFVIGLEIDLREIRAKSRFILQAAAGIIVLEATMGSLFTHYVFGTPWIIAIIVALSFATVGEAVLLPILEEFELVEEDVKAVTYGFFGPLFFLWVGIDANIQFLLAAPLLVLAQIIIVKAAKLSGSYLVGRSELGAHRLEDRLQVPGPVLAGVSAHTLGTDAARVRGEGTGDTGNVNSMISHSQRKAARKPRRTTNISERAPRSSRLPRPDR